ncbi:transmembrane protein [Mycobacteroides abscessus subsp. massiliense]|nr:transmembrane protein [Mycobacteroides abscessus subsp. massiliense]
MSVVIPLNEDAVTEPAELDDESAAGVDAAPTTAVPEQVRVAVEVGEWLVEQSLSAHAPLILVMEKLAPRLKETLDAKSLKVIFPDSAVFSLAYEGQPAFPRSQTLAELGVTDGEILVLKQIHSEEVFEQPIEDTSDALSEYNAVKFPDFTAGTARVMTLALAVVFFTVLAVGIIQSWSATPDLRWWFIPAAVVTAVTITGSALAKRRRGAPQIAYVLGIGAVIVAFAAGWVAIPAYDNMPGQWTAANVMSASWCAAAASLLVLWLTGIGTTVHTALVSLLATGAIAATVMTYTGFNGRQVGAVAVLVGLIMVVIAPGLALSLARVQPPKLPEPGEEIDRGELHEAGMRVEVFDDGSEVGRSVELSDSEDTELEGRSRLSNKYLTGLWVSAVITIVVSALAAIEPRTHYFVHAALFTTVLVLILGLRARTLPDRVLAITFFLGAFVLTIGAVLVVIAGHPNPVVQASVLGGFLVLTVATIVGGLKLPYAKLQDSTRHRIQRLETVMLICPPVLAFWITGLYDFARNFFGS